MPEHPPSALRVTGVRIVDSGHPTDAPVDIVIAGGCVAEIVEHGTAGPVGETIDGTHCLALPGFINGHQHSHELFFRGRSEHQRLEEWMTSVRPLKPLPLTPEDVYYRTLAVAIEALRTGTTTICDDIGIDPVRAPDLLRAAIRAYEDAGLRAFVGPSLFDVPFAQAVPFAEEELPAAALAAMRDAAGNAPSPTAILDAFRAFANELLRRDGLVRAIATPSAPQRCSPAFLGDIRALADDLGLPLMTHVLETRVQAVGAQLSYGRSMIAHLDATGFLKPATSLIHGVWLSHADMEIVARAGATVQINPWSNLKLGSGVADLRALIDAGINVSVGSDGCGSVETVSLMPSMAAAALLSTLRGETERWVSSRDVFQAATRGGAKALGLDNRIGRLAPGFAADLVLYRLDRPPFVPLNDALRQLVYADASAAIDTVIVAGRPVMRDGRVVSVDEDDVRHGVAAAHARLRPDLERAEEAAAALAPAMQAVRRRCLAHALPDGVPRGVLE